MKKKIDKNDIENRKLFEEKCQKFSEPLALAQAQATALEMLLTSAGFSLYTFFHCNGFRIEKKCWNKYELSIDASIKKHKGWIYAFYDQDDSPLYIGETGGYLRTRLNSHKLKADDNKWWRQWKTLKILPCESATSRKLFESLIGVVGGYRMMKMQPPAKDDLLYAPLLGIIDIKSNLPKTSLLRSHHSDEAFQFPDDEIIEYLIHLEAILKV